MAYLVRKEIRGKGYFYLVSSVRVGGRSKKFQRYLGPKKPSARELRRHSVALRRRVQEELRRRDPLLTLPSKAELKRLERVKRAYRDRLRQSPAVRENYYEWFITTYTYDSNAIEGSKLTLQETGMVLFESIAPPGRPLRDVRAAENHKKAFDWMVSCSGDLRMEFVLKLHRILTDGILPPSEAGRLRRVQVYVRGAEDVPPPPGDVEPQLRRLLQWYKANKRRYHPVVTAACVHVAFERTHPFVDFNGRSGRLLLNFVLLKHGYPPVDIRHRERLRYYRALRAAMGGDIGPFVNLVAGCLQEAGSGRGETAVAREKDASSPAKENQGS